MQDSDRPVFYAANTTVRFPLLVTTARQVIDAGANALLVNGLQVGLDGVAALARDSAISVPIHFHRAGFDILADGSRAIGLPCLSTLFRLSGADLVHVGPPSSPLFPPELVKDNCRRLSRKLPGLNPSLPVFSRSSERTIPLLLDSDASLHGLILCDHAAYGSPLGIEKELGRLRRMLD